jgi:hypothetical protein
MDQSLLYLVMILGGILMAAVPFGVFMGGTALFGISDPASSQLLVILFISVLVISYLTGLAALSVVQANSCGKIKSMKQIAGDAGLSTLIISIVLALAIFFPSLRSLVTGLFSPTIDPVIVQAIGYSYFLFWGALYGLVTGGYLSANCGT